MALEVFADKAKYRTVIAAADGIEAIIAATNAYRCDAESRGRHTHWNLAKNSGSVYSLASALAGGIEAIIAAAHAHPNEVSMQEQACVALSNLAFKD